MSDYNFPQIFKTSATVELLNIIDKPNEHQPLAVQAAQLELQNRQLTSEELERAKSELSTRRQEEENEQQRVKNLENKIKSIGTSLFDTVNPIQKETTNTDKFIKLISFFLIGLFLYQIIKDFGLLKFMFTSDNGKWDFSMVFYFLPFILVPIAGLLFWFRKKPGWILATLFFSYSSAGAIPSFFIVINSKPFGIQALDSLFPEISPIVLVGTFLLYGGLIWVMSKENIRTIYKIDKRTMFVTIGLGVTIIILMTLVW